MTINLVTFTDDKMTRSAALCAESAKRFGVDNAIVWQKYMITGEGNTKDVDKEFYEFNKDILDAERGAGFWLWKPYIIYKELLRLNEGDILIYADAGIEFVNDVQHIISRMDEDLFLFTNTHPNHHWTKLEVLDTMMPGWRDRYTVDTPWPQVQASIIFMKVTPWVKYFMKSWLLWCQMPGLITDDKRPCVHEEPYFQDHRHDQSILTILHTKHGLKRLHWWPTAYAEHIRVPGDNYPVMFNHHRKRDPGKGGGDVEWKS